MYEYIKGVLKKNSDGLVVIENDGIGYLLLVSNNTTETLSAVGEAVKVFCHLVHREDAFELIGFATEKERLLFRKLISVSGVGLKQAMKILSGMLPEHFVKAIVEGDITALVKIPGLGKKRAEKMVFELKDKLAGIEIVSVSGEPVMNLPKEAVAALESLGFPEMTARAAVVEALKDVNDEDNLEVVIAAALRHV